MIVARDGDDEILAVGPEDLVCAEPGTDRVVPGTLSDGTPTASSSDGSASSPETAPDSLDVQALANASTSSKPFGYHEIFHLTPNLLATAASGAANFARVIVDGCPGFSNWTPYQNAFALARSQGMRVLVGVIWRRDPAGADGICRGAHSAPYVDQAAAWQAFVRNTVNRALWHNGGGIMVEVWNEPNLRRFWNAFPEPAWYANAYRQAWQGVQDAEADWAAAGLPVNVPVMTAGLGRPGDPCGNFSNYICASEFLGRVKTNLSNAGALGMVEATGAHIYPDPNPPLISRAASIAQAGVQFNNVRNVFPSVTKPTVITEVGIRSNHPYNEPRQCNRLLDIYQGWLPSNLTGGLIVFRLVDDPDNPQEVTRRMGTVYANGNTKLAYRWLRDVHSGQKSWSTLVSGCG